LSFSLICQICGFLFQKPTGVERVRKSLTIFRAKGCPQGSLRPDENDSPSGHNNHFDPVALCAFSEIAQKLRPISIIPENLFPISARHDVVDRTGKLNPWRS
jgi:hypothetical protein